MKKQKPAPAIGSMRRFELIVIIAIFFLGALLRLWGVDRIPVSFANDEIFYVAQSRALAVSGSDLNGTWNPWTFTSAHILYAEWPGVIMTPLTWVLIHLPWHVSPLLVARATHILLGLLIVGNIGLLAASTTRSRRTGIIALTLAAINPWLFQFSRMSFDAVTSLALLTTGMVLVQRLPIRWLAASAPIWLLTLVQYQAYKLLVVPVLFSTLLLRWYTEHTTDGPTVPSPLPAKLRTRFLASAGVLFLLIVSATIMLFVRLQLQPAGNRVQELMTTDMSRMQRTAEEERRLSIPNNMANYSANKYTQVLTEVGRKYLDSFNHQWLFWQGDVRRNPFAVWQFGALYIWDALLIGIGIMVLARRNRQHALGWWLVSLIVLAPLPNAIKAGAETWQMFRSSLIVVPLLILSAIGLAALFERTRWSTWSSRIGIVLVLLYSVSAMKFFHTYAFTYPIFATQDSAYPARIAAAYIARLPATQKVVFLSDQPWFAFQHLLVYLELIRPENMAEIHATLQKAKFGFTVGRLTVDNSCFSPTQYGPEVAIIVDPTIQPCDEKQEPTAQDKLLESVRLRSVLDSRTLLTFYHDAICQPFALSEYPTAKPQLLQLPEISTKDFCEQILSR